jgi:hypothetical protein
MIITAVFVGFSQLPLWMSHRRNPVTGLYDRRWWLRMLGR